MFGDRLLTESTPDEIETVLAHELGHHVNKDIPLSIAFETVLTVVGLFLASLTLKWGGSLVLMGLEISRRCSMKTAS